MRSKMYAEVATAALVCILYAAICTAQSCPGNEEADIELVPNCTTQNLQVMLEFGPNLERDVFNLLDIEYSCSHKNMTSSGMLVTRQLTQGTMPQTFTTNHSLPWGTICVFTGCYTTENFVTNIRMFSIPSASCVLLNTSDNTSDVECALECGNYSECINSTCVCSQGLTVAKNGISCFNVSDCLQNETCYQCSENDTCECNTGFAQVEVDNGFLSCRDIDECLINNGGCEQRCVNIVGSFLCTCSEGHKELENGKCQLTQVSRLLLPVITVPIMLLLAGGVVMVTGCLIYMRARKRVNLHRPVLKMPDKLVDDLSIDFFATTYIEPDEESTFDQFLPSSTRQLSLPSMSELIDDIHRIITVAYRIPSAVTSKTLHSSEPNLLERPYSTHFSCAQSKSEPELVPSDRHTSVSQSRRDGVSTAMVTDQDEEYIVLSDTTYH